MSLLQKVKKFLKLPVREKVLFVEAVLVLGHKRRQLLRRPFKELSRSFELHDGFFESAEPCGKQLQIAYEIGRAISAAARYTPWESACLVQALGAQYMLQKRGIPGAFCLAVALNGNEGHVPLSAHAWVKCGPHFITGERGHERFTVVSTFSWKGSDTSEAHVPK